MALVVAGVVEVVISTVAALVIVVAMIVAASVGINAVIWKWKIAHNLEGLQHFCDCSVIYLFIYCILSSVLYIVSIIKQNNLS